MIMRNCIIEIGLLTSSSSCPLTMMMLMLISACSGGRCALRGGICPGPSGTEPASSSSSATASQAAAAGTAAHMLPLRPVAVPARAHTHNNRTSPAAPPPTGHPVLRGLGHTGTRTTQQGWDSTSQTDRL